MRFPLQILIVEDNPVNQTILKANLRKKGYQTVQAENGKHALGILENHETPFDVIVSDVMMPEMDGFEMVEKIKAHPEWKKIPVIMCTALADKEYVQKAILLGCNHYVTKPIKIKTLFAKIQDVLIDGSSTLLSQMSEFDSDYDEATSREIALSFSSLVEDKIRFLEGQVVEDTTIPINQKFADLKEAASGFGTKWINTIIDRLEESQKVMNGKLDSDQYFGLLKELRKLHAILPKVESNDEQIKTEEQILDFRNCIKKYNPTVLIKFDAMIAMLGYVQSKTCQTDNVESGMVAYDDVWASVGKLLISKGQEVNGKMMVHLNHFAESTGVIQPFRMVDFEEVLYAKPVKKRTEEKAQPADHVPPIDLKTAMEVVDGDRSLYQELLEDFLKALPAQLNRINNQISKRDAESIQREAHDIKGIAANLGVHHIVKDVVTLERFAKTGSFADAKTVTKKMNDDIASVMVHFFNMDWEDN